MTVTAAPAFAFDNTFVRELPGLYEPWQPAPAPAPRLLVLNEAVAIQLGLDPDVLRRPEGVAVLVGNALPDGAASVAQAYAGHQFGGFSPRLGDGRALLVGELLDVDGNRVDLHLKGSGRTPFSRGGDGKAAIGPMLREHVIGEAMHALGIPTTRALAVIATGEEIARETMLPGAVLARVAASHLRVGTFEYAARDGDPTLLRRLVHYAIARHHPAAADAPNPYLALFEAVLDAQAALVARWMLVGFVHGVMNTDNMTISGETIDYGPCAFMDAYDPATVFSSIDHGGRYAFGNQPLIAQWNLARLAETLVPLIDDDRTTAIDAATEVLQSFTRRYESRWRAGMRAKLGLAGSDDATSDPEADQLVDDLLAILLAHRVDHTAAWRALAAWLRGRPGQATELFGDAAALAPWTERWSARVDAGGRSRDATADAMDAVNPVYIPRNHLVEEALAAATDGDLAPLSTLLDVLARPYDEQPGRERYAVAAPPSAGRYRTFCGT